MEMEIFILPKIVFSLLQKKKNRKSPKTNPIATQACKDWTKGLDNSGPTIIFINPLSATSKDPDPKVIIPKTKIEDYINNKLFQVY